MHIVLCLALLSPSVGSDLNDLPSDLAIVLAKPPKPFRLGEPMPMRVKLTNTSPFPLEVSGVAIEGCGHFASGLQSIRCGMGRCRTASMITSTQVRVVIEPVPDGNSHKAEEVELLQLNDELAASMSRFELAPRESAEIEFDLLQTRMAALIDSPGEYLVGLRIDSETSKSTGFATKIRRWQGRAISNIVRINVTAIEARAATGQ